RGPARVTDRVARDANELAALGDDEQLALVVHGERADDLSRLLGRLHVDDALAAPRLQAIRGELGTLSVTALGERECLFVALHHGGRHDVIALFERDAAHAARLPAHVADARLLERDRNA